ncbi:MAG: hypothetical protein IJK81_05165 [Selenomonadaceae bacterium]|nr:hypothetical protein [Selenomonadaceae bacterium]
MTEEKNINASAEQNKFADEILIDKEIENVAGGFSGKFRSTDNFDDATKNLTTGK